MALVLYDQETSGLALLIAGVVQVLVDEVEAAVFLAPALFAVELACVDHEHLEISAQQVFGLEQLLFEQRKAAFVHPLDVGQRLWGWQQ